MSFRREIERETNSLVSKACNWASRSQWEFAKDEIRIWKTSYFDLISFLSASRHDMAASCSRTLLLPSRRDPENNTVDLSTDRLAPNCVSFFFHRRRGQSSATTTRRLTEILSDFQFRKSLAFVVSISIRLVWTVYTWAGFALPTTSIILCNCLVVLTATGTSGVLET